MDFIIQNWKFFAIIASILLDLVLVLIFKKRPSIIDNSFLTSLCCWIQEAEKQFKDGKEKLNFVLAKAEDELGCKYNRHAVTVLVEWVLSLPQKKGKL